MIDVGGTRAVIEARSAERYLRAERLDAADDSRDRKRGVLLALASHIALLIISNKLAMQIALSLAGILVMIAVATVLSSIELKPRRRHDVMKTATSGWPLVSDISYGKIDQSRPGEVRQWANSR
ncbi:MULTISPECIES: hypothetical protein [Bradyrhizobium]|uniref:hypothetical protein n=1 Tax=Bradyrhizobium TaxID=374 RepID=UPI0004816BD1|nr:hypothetical protein [Bradyrhizobium japonicum]AJA61614.1 hypothetical protein RN69_15500 [Bradyrhizobium japonicum]KMJ93589.1 hypothetical protein CF64_42120 [Bradyrhizobium japonicum]MCS3533226.1 hypothetical protein [Bradyrhizobium japonicum]MCS3898365.1 hypothetical protein [Bradyrhizobium japonicum USDA 38]MCS3941418.1 hypothetical protein [Bradyrhizobium japonicum]